VQLVKMYYSATTDPVLTVRRSTFVIGRHGSGLPSRLSLAMYKEQHISQETKDLN